MALQRPPSRWTRKYPLGGPARAGWSSTTAVHLLSSHRQALICSPSVDIASESRCNKHGIAHIVRRESNVNFLFRLSLEFYRLVSSSVARGSIPNDQRPVRRPLGFH